MMMFRTLATAALTLLALTIAGCTSTTKIELPHSTSRLSTPNPLPGIERLRHQVVTVEKSQSALDMVKNRQQFLTSLLKQSYDTYYGTPRIPDECLTLNKIGPLEDQRRFHARLSVDDHWNPGYCYEGRHKAVAIVGTCSATPRVYEVDAMGPAVDRLTVECQDHHVNLVMRK